MEEKKNLTAKEARELAESSHFLSNQVYKQIKDEAKFNMVCTRVCIEGQSSKVVDEVLKDLRDKGYKADYEDNYSTLYIAW